MFQQKQVGTCMLLLVVTSVCSHAAELPDPILSMAVHGALNLQENAAKTLGAESTCKNSMEQAAIPKRGELSCACLFAETKLKSVRVQLENDNPPLWNSFSKRVGNGNDLGYTYGHTIEVESEGAFGLAKVTNSSKLYTKKIGDTASIRAQQKENDQRAPSVPQEVIEINRLSCELVTMDDSREWFKRYAITLESSSSSGVPVIGGINLQKMWHTMWGPRHMTQYENHAAGKDSIGLQCSAGVGVKKGLLDGPCFCSAETGVTLDSRGREQSGISAKIQFDYRRGEYPSFLTALNMQLSGNGKCTTEAVFEASILLRKKGSCASQFGIGIKKPLTQDQIRLKGFNDRDKIYTWFFRQVF